MYIATDFYNNVQSIETGILNNKKSWFLLDFKVRIRRSGTVRLLKIVHWPLFEMVRRKEEVNSKQYVCCPVLVIGQVSYNYDILHNTVQLSCQCNNNISPNFLKTKILHDSVKK